MSNDRHHLHLRTERDGPRVTVSIAGELDLASVPQLLDCLLPLARLDGATAAEVLLDAGALVFVDVAGLGALTKAATTLAATGGSLRLRRSTPQLDRLLTVLGLDHGFAPVTTPDA